MLGITNKSIDRLYIYFGRLSHLQCDSVNCFICDTQPGESLIFIIIIYYLEFTPQSEGIIYFNQCY
jgi:hypothetical protein